MSIAAAQASKFYEQTVREGRVFTLEAAEGFLAFPIRDIEVIPFWSSRSRVERIKKRMPEYSGYAIHEKSFQEFYEQTLPWLEEQHVHVGVNWSGARLSGYDLTVSDVRSNLDYWTQRKRPNQPPQRNAGSRPSSGDPPVSETQSSFGPRGSYEDDIVKREADGSR